MMLEGCRPGTDAALSSLSRLLREGQFPKMTAFSNLDDFDAEMSREQLPCGCPSVALLKATNGENGLFAFSPAHPRAFKPLGGERLTRCLHDAAPNWKSSILIGCIVHALPLVLKVSELGTQQFAPPLEPLASQLTS